MTLHDLSSRKRAARMLRPYSTAIAALAIDSEEAAAAHASLVYEGMPAPLRAHQSGYTAAVNWNTAIRLWVDAVRAPGLSMLHAGEPWVELDIHNLLHVHATRDGIGEPDSDRQQARLDQAQAALFPVFANAAITNVEAVTHRSADGRVVGMTLCAPLGKEILWSIAVDMERARRLLYRWRSAEVPWLAHNARTMALVSSHKPSTPATSAAASALPQQAQPTRRFRPKPQAGSGASTGA